MRPAEIFPVICPSWSGVLSPQP